MHDVIDQQTFPWAEQLSPRMLKSPWWIGHIPFAYELVGRLRPKTLVELGTYSGSSFAAFCQAVEACGLEAKCYGIDLWQGDIHMGRFEEDLFQEVCAYMAANYPSIATLVRKDFNEAVDLFGDGSVDLLHIDGTHTFEAVSNDFNTWLPKMSDRGVVLFHDINVTVKNAGEKALQFGVRKVFDSVKARYSHFEFAHCWGLGVLIVGQDAPAPVMEMVEMSRDPRFEEYFAARGALVLKQYDDLNVELPLHDPYSSSTPMWRLVVNRFRRLSRRLLRAA
jgi:predicted O-methyltransferase YrrM